MESEIRNIFQEVADLAKTERDRYYDSHGVTAGARAEVESLLRFDQTVANSGGTLGSVVVNAASEWAIDSAAELYCGPYRLIRMLAQGGMGAVYLGERKDGEVELKVAVKFVNAAIAGAKDFGERFLRERQILASLTHPGIARLLDAGRTQERGSPYLVMEYVDGAPIDVYCEKIGVDARLRLFLDVCDAVSYSHRSLIIHRDLKPSNILVNREGHAKLLDFGIAKILDEAAEKAGVTRERLLTPEYASPEQERGQANTTATDIYSLGAILRRIFEVGHEAVPVPPADLDYIVRMAMRQEAGERYASVDALAEDVRALLESRPVRARSGDVWYRSRKLLRRYWLPLSAVAAALLSLAGGLFVANRERDVAQARFAQLRRLANTMLHFDASLRVLPGSTKAREEVVIASLQYLDGLRGEASRGIDSELAMEVANGYKIIGEVQGAPRTANLGKRVESELTLGKGGEMVDRVLAKEPARTDALLLRAEIEADLAAISDSNDSGEGVVQHSAACDGFVQRLLKTGAASNEQKLTAAGLLANAGLANTNMQIMDGAAKYLTASIALSREVGPQSRALVQSLSNLSSVLRKTGDLDGALRFAEEAEAVHAKVEYSDERTRMVTTYTLLSRRGQLLDEDESISLRRPQDAIGPLTAARDLAEEWVAKDPNDSVTRDLVGKMGRGLGDILRHTDPAKALAAYELGIVRIRAVDNVDARRSLARYLAKTADPLRKLGRAAEGRRRLDQAIEILKQTKDYPPPPDDLAAEVDGVMRGLAQHELETGSPAKARETYERLLGWVEERHIGPSTLLLANDLSRLYEAMAKVYAALGMRDEVQKMNARRLQVWTEWDRKLPSNPWVRGQLAAFQGR